MGTLIFLLSLSLSLVTGQSINSCTNQNTCNECIQTKGCSWCLKLISGSDDSPKCLSNDSINGLCDRNFIENPRNSPKILEFKPLTEGGAQEGGKIVQIRPQRMSLKLRINQPQRITLTYSRAQDYPVDLYYLMDLSFSMNVHKDKLSTLGKKIANVMTNITKDFRLGFGSFVDKTTLPYVSTVPKNLRKPCSQCKTGPYSFKNHMKLNTDASSFEREVRNAPISGNIDTPEGGFDALMQVLVCPEEIGWREQARRLVVFSTDARFHYAGDGKLGGVVKPNDGECHMKNHTYTHSLIQDYPSIAQINSKVKQNAVNLIFAVTKGEEKTYKKLSEHIEGSYFSRLELESTNIVELIRDQYSKISSTVEMKDNHTEAIDVKYFSKCLGGRLELTKKCDNIKVGDKVDFEILITATSCRTSHRQTLKISPVGIDESLIIDIDLICTCDCEKPTHKTYEISSSKCKNQGIHICGVCECDDGFTGRVCECSDSSSNANDTNCAKIDCNNRGNCVCGVCECDKRANPEEIISGKYCECDNFSCKRNDGLFCSGHGTCKCNECDCDMGWIGDDCTCRNTTDTCRVSSDMSICSGNGECECGECQCKKTEKERYFGRFCDKCPNCPGRCQEFKDCVQCQVYGTGPLSSIETDLCKQNCTNAFTRIDVKNLNETTDEDDLLCTFFDENDCQFKFIYNDRDKVVIRTDKTLICQDKIFSFTVIISIVGSIVLIGLATLLLWKCITTIQDRKEFARFEEERKMACWDSGQNPIYRQATSTFRNPTYMETKEE